MAAAGIATASVHRTGAKVTSEPGNQNVQSRKPGYIADLYAAELSPMALPFECNQGWGLRPGWSILRQLIR